MYLWLLNLDIALFSVWKPEPKSVSAVVRAKRRMPQNFTWERIHILPPLVIIYFISGCLLELQVMIHLNFESLGLYILLVLKNNKIASRILCNLYSQVHKWRFLTLHIKHCNILAGRQEQFNCLEDISEMVRCSVYALILPEQQSLWISYLLGVAHTIFLDNFTVLENIC